MTGAEFHAEDLKRREVKKEAKKEQHIKPEKVGKMGDFQKVHRIGSKLKNDVYS